MRLQKQLSRKIGDKEYAKWVVVLPPSLVKMLEWKEGEELEVRAKYGGLILIPKKLKLKNEILP